MGTLFLACAILGGIVLVLQFVLGLVGVGAEAAELQLGATDASEGLNLLSVRSLAAGATFFGLGGLLVLSLGLPWFAALPVGLCTGAGAAVGTALLMRSMLLLESDGTVRLERAVGEAGTVYLRIPGNNAGPGKVLLTLQGRTVECQAVTSLDEIPTGALVIVVDIAGPDTVEVAPAPTLGGLLDASS